MSECGSRYSAGCRCSACRADNAARARDYLHRRRNADSPDPVKSAAGKAGAVKRWGDTPRIVRIGDLSPDARRAILAAVEEMRSPIA